MSLLAEASPSGSATEDVLGATLKEELDVASLRITQDAESVSTKKSQLERAIAEGDNRLAETGQRLEADLGEKARASDQVESHKSSLEELARLMEKEVAAAKSKGGQQAAAAKRFEEERATAERLAAEARRSAADARQRREDAVAEGKAQILAADHAVCEAEANAAKASEALVSCKAAAQSLVERAEALASQAAVTERELDFHSQAAATTAREHEVAKASEVSAQSAARDASALVANHMREASRRLEAGEAELNRARRRHVALERLRSLGSRNHLAGEDAIAFAERAEAATEAAREAAEGLARAEASVSETRAADAANFTTFSAAARRTAQDAAQRERVTASVAVRLAAREAAAQEAHRRHCAAKAAAEAATEELTRLERRAMEELTRVAQEAEAKAEAARAAQATARREAAEAEVLLRHTEEAEALALVKREEAMQRIVDSIARATAAVAESQADAAQVDCGSSASGIAELLRVELATSRERMQQRRDQEEQMKAGFAEEELKWKKEKEAMSANLHRASLRLAHTVEDLAHNLEIRDVQRDS